MGEYFVVSYFLTRLNDHSLKWELSNPFCQRDTQTRVHSPGPQYPGRGKRSTDKRLGISVFMTYKNSICALHLCSSDVVAH